MSWFSNLSIVRKISTIPFLLLAIMLVAASITVWNLLIVSDQIKQARQALVDVQTTASLLSDLQHNNDQWYKLASWHAQGLETDTIIKAGQNNLDEAKRLLDQLDRVLQSGTQEFADNAQREQIITTASEYRKQIETVAGFSGIDPFLTLSFMNTAQALFDQLDPPLQTGISRLKAVADQEQNEAERLLSQLLVLTATAPLAAAIVGLIISTIMGRAIAKPVIELTETTRMMAAGELTDPIRFTECGDELGTMALALSDLCEKDRQRLKLKDEQAIRIKKVDRLISEAEKSNSSQFEAVQRASNDLAASAEQMNRAMSDFDVAFKSAESEVSQVQAISDQISRSTNETRKAATSTIKVMGEAREAINSLSETARSIEESAAMIGQIADQTNLLALNASIEAGRAGVHGKGFSVVAAEIKSLAVHAARSSEAIVSASNGAHRSVTQTNGAMSCVTEGIQSIFNAAGSVDEAANQQSAKAQLIRQQIETASELANQLNKIVSDDSAGEKRHGSFRQSLNSVTKAVGRLEKNIATFSEEVRSA